MAIVLSVIALTFLPLCGMMFSCGCSLLHGDRHCNIHDPGLPHCPWCEAHWAVMAGVVATTLAAAGTGAYGGLRGRRLTGWRRMLAGSGLGVASYLVVASLCGLIMAIVMRYPMWWRIHVFE